MRFRSALFAALACWLPHHAADAQQVQQSEITIFTQTISGAPAVCGVEFAFVFKDNVTGYPAPGGATGSVAFAELNGLFAAIVKVHALIGLKPIPVNSVSLRAKGKYLVPARSNCLDRNNFCGVLYSADAGQVLQGLASNDIDVRYNIVRGNLDYALPINFYDAVNLKREKEPYLDCVQRALNRSR